MSEGAARGITAHVMSAMHSKGVMFVTIGIALHCGLPSAAGRARHLRVRLVCDVKNQAA